MPEKSLQDWLNWLETLSAREIVLGLERVQECLARLRLDRPGYVVHIAGTNGKGSCAEMLQALLRIGGERTGCYTSPHLVRYNERIRIDGVPCSDEEIVAAFEQVEAARGELPLTYFEFGTLAALQLFHNREVSAAVLEVGMGGRLDAVNAVEPDGGIITNVALDHCAWLGSSVEAIALEKAGIMRRGRPLIYGAPDTPSAITERAREMGAELRVLGLDYDYEQLDAHTWRFRGRDLQLDGLLHPAPGADVQLQNSAAVLALLEATGRSGELASRDVDAAFSGLELRGRLQHLHDDHEWLLDVAHNPAAARVLARALPEVARGRRVIAILSVLGDKDVAGMVAPLCPLVDTWIAAGIPAARARPAAKVAQVVAESCGRPCLISASPAAAIEHAEDLASANELILVTGSFYVVGPVLDELYSRRTGE